MSGVFPDMGIPPSQTSQQSQADFRAIQDAYSKVKLPGDLKFQGSKVGIKNTGKESANILINVAKYGETIVKVLLTM